MRAATVRKQKVSEAEASSLLGVGDKDYPLSKEIATAFGQQRTAVNKMSSEWMHSHSQPLSCDNEIPETKPKSVCSDTCFAKEMSTMSEAQRILLGKVVGLLKNITREMKQPYYANKKQLTENSRHPVFLCKCHGEMLAWLLTQPGYKPLTFDAIELQATLSETSQTVCCMQLKTHWVQNQEVWTFVSLKRVAVDMVRLHGRFPEQTLYYGYTKSYKLFVSRPLSHFFATVPAWVEFSRDAPDDANGDNEDDDDDGDDFDRGNAAAMKQDVTDISSMVDNLLDPGPGEVAPRKRRARGKPSASFCFLLFICITACCIT